MSRLLTTCGLVLLCMVARSQEFFNLTAQEVRIDSVLPLFSHVVPLGLGYADSVYTVSIDYPEFIDMSPADTVRLRRITSRRFPSLPVVGQYVGVERRRASLYTAFTPIVYREGRWQKLVSFKLTVKGQPRVGAAARQAPAEARATRAGTPADRYAAHSVLATGRWAKIRVPATGVYQLTDALIRRAGFTDLNKVKVYGYGGALQPERLTADYLTATDDLREVATCTVGGRRFFYATGPVSWISSTAVTRTRNPYSDYGYYFLTENDSTPLTVSEADFQGACYPAPGDYHTLYEVDDYAWYHGGRNLFDSRLFGTGSSRSYELEAVEGAQGQLTVALSYDAPFAAEVTVGDSTVATIEATSAPDKYSKGALVVRTYRLRQPLPPTLGVTIRQVSGGDLRLDYLSLRYDKPRPWPELATAALPVPEYVYGITNQDHHADTAADMVIIIPTTQRLLSQAQRLADYHAAHDSLRVRIVPADELYNEYSSGTPDAGAYRRYLKMLYDRAVSEADMPRYLLLFGDGAWDNRMLTTPWRQYSPDDFLLCYESENSFSETDCYVTDDYFCLMDDGEGASLLVSDKSDVAVGRLSARSEAEARVMVDKTIGYMQNAAAGAWQNTLCFLGDDGDNNRHMRDAEAVANMAAELHPDFNIRKVYWDAYQRQSSSTGYSYPEVTRLIRQQMQQGALLMNYSGHGAAYTMSHEQVLHLDDFTTATSQRLPLWLTASCDIMPFDGQEENIGEAAMGNAGGGAVAFYGTTRTVYSNYNGYMNRAYTRYVLGTDDQGRRCTIGEAARKAKNLLMTPASEGNDIGLDQTTNKLQYTLLGDPALVLAAPTMQVVVDSLSTPAGRLQGSDGAPVAIGVGQTVTVAGHIEGDAAFDGVVTLTVKDVEQVVTCRLNDATAASTPMAFTDRPNTFYTGTDSVRGGRFTVSFTLPRDISYTEGTGLMTLYALSSDRQRRAHGSYDGFTMTGDTLPATDGIGPHIYCYLNAQSFTNGDQVNTTPLFHAELSDRDGINVSTGGIGHDMELTVERLTATGATAVAVYVLNDYFQFSFGDYRSGSLDYVLPALGAGSYRLRFRAWDAMNNSSVSELLFTVAEGLEPAITSLECSPNPAREQTTFTVSHDRAGALVDVAIDVFDTSGRQLWHHSESGTAAGQAYHVTWDLTTSGGHRLSTGVYLYRVSMSCDGSRQATKARKLIVLRP